MRLAFFLLGFILLQGCLPNLGLSTSAAADINISNLARLKKGMTQTEVLKIMRQPYSDQMFAMDKDIYDVWYYVKEPTVLGQSRMMPLNLAPLTFKNGKLIGSGYGYVNYLKRRQREAETPQLIVPKETLERPPTHDENFELEKILVPTSQPLAPSAPKNPAPTSQPLAPSAPQIVAPAKQAAPKGKDKSAQPLEQPLDLSPLEPQAPTQPQTTPQKTQGAPAKQGTAQPTKQGPNRGSLDSQPTQVPTQSQGNPQTTEDKKRAAQPTQQGPNWGPLEPQQAPAPTPAQPAQSTNGPKEVSMSRNSKKNAADTKQNTSDPEPKKEEKKVPFTEEDEEMLRDERMQDFDQT